MGSGKGEGMKVPEDLFLVHAGYETVVERTGEDDREHVDASLIVELIERIAELEADRDEMKRQRDILLETDIHKTLAALKLENERLKAAAWAVLEDDDCDSCDGECGNQTCAYQRLREALADIGDTSKEME